MKLYKKLFLLPAVAALTAVSVGSCSEEATLSGADAVYIELTPASVSLCLEDTVRVTARVTNVSGDVLQTAINWTSDNNAIEIVEDTVANSTLITCADGAQGVTAKLRATLENDQYAVTTVTVMKATPQGVNAIDAEGNVLGSKRSWDMIHDSINFVVSPKQLLLDYDPVVKFNDLEVSDMGYGDTDGDGVVVDRKKGMVSVHFRTGLKAAEGSISVSVGSGASAKTGKCDVSVIPNIEGATFYGPDYAAMPYIDKRPTLGTLSMYYAYTYERVMDVNSSDTLAVAFMVLPGLDEISKEAFGCYKWECVEGNSVMKIVDEPRIVKGNGFDAVFAVRSGLATGKTVFHCVTPDTVLVATFDVHDYKNEFPVNSISASVSEINAEVGEDVFVTMGVDPIKSFAYHKPKAHIADPSIVKVSDYNGRELTFTGLKAGSTTVTFTSNEAPPLVIPVTITEGVRSITFERGDIQSVFEGLSVTWTANVVTASGRPNTSQVQFASSDESVATVAPVAGTVDKVTVHGVSAGETPITASLGSASGDRPINVVAVPDAIDFEVVGVTTDNDGTGLMLDCDGHLFNLAGAWDGASEPVGSFNVADYTATFELDGARASIVSGTLTVAPGDEEGYYTVTFTFEVDFGDKGRRTYTGTAIQAENWLF